MLGTVTVTPFVRDWVVGGTNNSSSESDDEDVVITCEVASSAFWADVAAGTSDVTGVACMPEPDDAGEVQPAMIQALKRKNTVKIETTTALKLLFISSPEMKRRLMVIKISKFISLYFVLINIKKIIDKFRKTIIWIR
ncbi:MAG: hypothetical protein WCX22_02905, partial [Methanoregula sp.]